MNLHSFYYIKIFKRFIDHYQKQMTDKQGCEEGCRTYIDDTVGKIIFSIVLITFVIALISGVILYSNSLNQEDVSSTDTPESGINDTSDNSILNGNISKRTGIVLQNEPVRITSLNTTDEYIQLKNYGIEPMNLSGWKVADKSGEHIFTFPNVSLKPQQTITIYSGADAENKTDQKGIIIWTTDEVWDDKEDQAVLYDNSGKEIDEKY